MPEVSKGGLRYMEMKRRILLQGILGVCTSRLGTAFERVIGRGSSRSSAIRAFFIPSKRIDPSRISKPGKWAG